MTNEPRPRSAEVSRSRPFYAGQANAYDLLITDPVEPWVWAVHTRLTLDRLAPASILDAGCGTGRHAAALQGLGHRMTLLDASPDLLRLAARVVPGSETLLADLCALDLVARFTAITCRGVLNDLLTDTERQAAVNAMTAALTPGGVLFCDVREATASRARADGRSSSRAVALPSAGSLTFTTTTTWSDGLIQGHEEHVIRHDTSGVLSDEGTDVRSVYDFAMRPWTPAELRDRLHGAGFPDIRIGPGIGRRTPDRLFVTARKA